MLYEVRKIAEINVKRSRFLISRILRPLGISRVWYYRPLIFCP